MWSARQETLERGRVLKVALERDSGPLAYSDVLRLWQSDAEFRAFFIDLLARTPFPAFRWETPPVTAATASRAFEFVLLDAPELARTADPEAFAEHFDGVTHDVVSFANLGGDARLVVPAPRGSSSAYGHLAAFVREAPDAQRHALWVEVGRVMERRLGRTPVWLSTAGAGVPWLHVRLDDRPKYYGHMPYRKGA
jgi:hypothetical protein